MLGDDDLLAWFSRLDITEPTRSLITQIRSTGPSRRVWGGRSNMTGRIFRTVLRGSPNSRTTSR